MANSLIPTVDLSPFFREDDEDGKRKAMEAFTKACSVYGFFQFVNRGVPINLLQRALDLSKTFFEYPIEEKMKSSAASDAPVRTGYNMQVKTHLTRKEHLLMFPPCSSFNIFPDNPPEFKQVLEDLFSNLSKTGVLLEGILNQCLGLPPNFLKEFNHDKSWDFKVALRYFPATEDDRINRHEDSNCFTFVFQDEAGGLEVHKDGEWIPVIPVPGTLVVNISDVIQGEKWVEPLPQFTKDIGEPPKYRGFQYNEYMQLRVRNKTHPPARPEDEIRITQYKITTYLEHH